MLYEIKTLKGFDAFKKAYLNGKTKSTRKITMTIVEGESNTLNLGVGISKKRCKKAVVRNRIKRLLRESIKQLNKERRLNTGIQIMTLFWKIAPNHPMQIRLDEVKSEVDIALGKFSHKN